MTEREALKLALEALETLMLEKGSIYDRAITAIREALAQERALQALHDENERLGLYKDAYEQPEQEPVVWMYQDKTSHAVKFQRHMSNFVDHSKTSEIPLYSEPLANHELQCVCGAVWCGDEMVHLPNKTPPQRTWVGLTDEEIFYVWLNEMPAPDKVFYQKLCRSVEAKLKEKNHV